MEGLIADNDEFLLLILGLAFFASALLLLFAFGDDDRSKRTQKRMEKVAKLGTPYEEAVKKSLRRDRGEVGFLERYFGRFIPRRDVLERRLARTGRNISLGRFAASCFLVGLVVFAIFYLVIGLGWLIALVNGVGLGLWLPQFVIRVLGDIRVGRFMKNFPEAIDLMVRGLRSGLPISESINAVSGELKPPISTEFAKVSHSIHMGEALEPALWEVTKRIDAPEYKFLIIALAIQRETGGNLAETLSNLADILRKRAQLKLKIKALSSEARASAWIIGSLPFIMFGMLLFLNYDYMSLLFTDPRGMILIGLGLTMVIMGVVVMAKMVRFDY